jgi:uncharacterized protein
MTMNKMISTAAAIAGLAFCVGTASAQTVGIATSNPGSLFHNIGTAVANAANAAGLNTTITPATSPNQFIPFLNSGGIEFGVANLQEVNYALTGEAWWTGNPNENLRIVAFLQPLVEGIFVRADSGITTLEQLRGQPMTDGFTAQNTILPQLDAFYSTAGMTREDMIPVSVASVTAGADAFMAGDAVGFILVACAPWASQIPAMLHLRVRAHIGRRRISRRCPQARHRGCWRTPSISPSHRLSLRMPTSLTMSSMP